MKKLLVILLAFISLSSFSQDILKTCQIKYKNCTLFEKPIPGEGIGIKKGETVDVLDVEDGFYKVNYKGNIGYVSELFIYAPELQEILKQRKLQEQANSELRKQQHKENYKKELIEKYGESRARLILAKQVCIGMSKDEALESWGEPSGINKTTHSFGIHEQWVYEGKNYKNRYLYFEDGTLKTIQE